MSVADDLAGAASRAAATNLLDEAAPAYLFEVALPGPLDVPASLDFFRRAGDDLLDRWDGARLIRTQPVGGRLIPYVAESQGTLAAPALLVSVQQPEDRAPIEEALRQSFMQPPSQDYTTLLRVDALVAELDMRWPGLRPVRQFDFFTALVRCISAQQVNLRWATTTRRRLAETFGERHLVGTQVVYSLSAPRLAEASVADLRTLQLTTRKAEYLIGAAQEVASGALVPDALAALPDEAVIARLTALRGVGRWSAEWLLARWLGRPCVVAGDLAVRKVVGAAYLGWRRGAPLPDEAATRAATAHWGAAAGVAQALLLHGYGASGA